MPNAQLLIHTQTMGVYIILEVYSDQFAAFVIVEHQDIAVVLRSPVEEKQQQRQQQVTQRVSLAEIVPTM